MGAFLSICLGGAVGTGARYLLASWLNESTGGRFPLGTLAVNLVGSFLLGAIMTVGLESDMLSPRWRTTLAIGVMGGFTTYSTFNYETLEYARQGATLLAFANVFATVFGCLVAGILGSAAGRWVVGS